MCESKPSQFVSIIAIEDSGPRTMSESDQSEQSISIIMENSEPNSLSDSSEKIPITCDKTKTSSTAGVTNLGFVEDRDVYNDNKQSNQRSSPSSFEEITMSSDTDCDTASKLELADLSPRVITDVSTKNGLTEEQYKEYFMSENDLKNSFRGEQTKNRGTKNCGKLCCWMLSLALLAGAITVAVLIGIGVIDTDPVRQVKESRNLEIEAAGIEEIHTQTFMEVANTSGPNVLTNDPAFFFSKKAYKKETEYEDEVKHEFELKLRVKQGLEDEPEYEVEPKVLASVPVTGETPELVITNEIRIYSENVTNPNEHENKKKEIVTVPEAAAPTELVITNEIRISQENETAPIAVHEHTTTEDILVPDVSITVSLPDPETSTMVHHDEYLYQNEILSDHEGSAQYELSYDANISQDTGISLDMDNLSEGSTHFQHNMQHFLDDVIENGSGEEDTVDYKPIHSSGKVENMTVENTFEEMVGDESLEVNIMEPRGLKFSTIDSSNDPSESIKERHIANKFPLEADFVNGQFLREKAN